MTALLIGTALAVASLCYVLYPLYRSGVAAAPVRAIRPGRRTSRGVSRLERVVIAVGDYDALKARYTAQALTAIRAGNAPVCEKCGPRPEADAEFCSRCGAALVA